MASLDLIQLDQDIDRIVQVIKEQRKAQNYLVKDLAKRANVSPQFIIDTCRNHSQPRLKTVLQTLQILGYTLEVKKL